MAQKFARATLRPSGGANLGSNPAGGRPRVIIVPRLKNPGRVNDTTNAKLVRISLASLTLPEKSPQLPQNRPTRGGEEAHLHIIAPKMGRQGRQESCQILALGAGLKKVL